MSYPIFLSLGLSIRKQGEYPADNLGKSGYPNNFTPLSSSGVSNVHLSNFFQQAAVDVVDFNLPDDSHLCIRRYKFMAVAVVEHF